MNANCEHNIDKELRNAVIYTLGYYSLFKYPITAEEILSNLPEKCSLPVLSDVLEDLVSLSEIYCYDGYYCLKEDIKNLTIRRLEANKLARLKLPMATKRGALIYQFPFVRFVGISGSLSKGYADQESDFDFFVVTEANRLWICRTLLHLFKKLTFLFGKQHEFCMNYFIDVSSLEIEEKNRFTAIEVASVIPTGGKSTYEIFNNANQWINEYLPNGYLGFYCEMPALKDKNAFIKKALESGFNMFSPQKLNKKLMDITDKKWRKKWSNKNFPANEYDVAFKTTLHISKNHPANHQKRVLEAISKFEPDNSKL
jgi:hypothetical protein